jgi:hypothetical protein
MELVSYCVKCCFAVTHIVCHCSIALLGNIYYLQLLLQVFSVRLSEVMHYNSYLYTLCSNTRKTVSCILDIGDPRKIFDLGIKQICLGTRPINPHEHKNIVINTILNTQRFLEPHT